MSSEALSQSEIDLLFDAGAAPETVTRDRKVDVQVYDFSRPSLISKERQRALDAMYTVLAKSVEVWLAGRVRGQLELSLMGVDQLSYAEFVMSLPSPSASFVFDVEGTSQQAVVDFGQEFAFFLVERLLGASGAAQAQQRALTPLERMLVRIAADRIAEQLKEIWIDHTPLSLEMSRFESVPDMIQAGGRQDPVLVGNLLVRASGMESTLLLCLPFNAVEKFFSGSGTERTAQAKRADAAAMKDRTIVREHVRGARLDVAARTSPCMLSMAALRRLRPGSTLITGLGAEPQPVIHVEEKPRFIAALGRAGVNLAARILESYDDVSGNIVTPHAQVTDRMDKGSTATVEPQLTNPAEEADGFGRLLTLSLPVTIELGRARMTVQEVLELGRGSIVQLDRLVGEPVDVLVGERRFAEGEVVVLGEQFGVRITRILGTNGTGQ